MDWEVYLLDLNRAEGTCRLLKEYQAQDGKWGIYEPVGVLNELNLTHHPAADSWGRWLPEGNKISFGSERAGDLVVDRETGEIRPAVYWYFLDLESLEVTPLRALYPAGGAPTWSPDGKYVAYEQVLAPWQLEQLDQAEPEIWIADHEGNTKRFLTHGNAPSWSPRGDWIAFLHYPYGLHDRIETEVHLIHPDGTDSRLLLKNQAPIHLLDWSHDGQKIAFLAGGDAYIVDVSGGQIVRILDINSGGISVAWSPDDKWLAYDSRDGIYAVHVEQPWIIVLFRPQGDRTNCYFPDWAR